MLLSRACACATACLTLFSALACGPSAASPAPTPPAAAGAPSAGAGSPVPAVSGSPAAVASPARPTASPSSAVASASPLATASAASAGSVPAGGTRLALDPADSSASYHAREQLAGRPAFSDAVGTSKKVTGQIVLTADGAIASDQSQVVVDLTALQSDESRRDNFIKNNTLQVAQFPQATFVPKSASGLPSPLPSSGDTDFTLSGDLTVHGVTKPVTWQVTGHFAGSDVSGTATANVKMTDFGMTPPQVGPVLGIEDGLVLQVDFAATAAS